MSSIDSVKELIAQTEKLLANNENTNAVNGKLKTALTSLGAALFLMKEEGGIKRPFLCLGSEPGPVETTPICANLDFVEINQRLRNYVFSVFKGEKLKNIERDHHLVQAFKILPVHRVRGRYLHGLILRYERDFNQSRVAASRFFGLHPVTNIPYKYVEGTEDMWFFAFYYLSEIYGSKKALAYLNGWQHIKRPENMLDFTSSEDYCVHSLMREKIIDRIMHDFKISLKLI